MNIAHISLLFYISIYQSSSHTPLDSRSTCPLSGGSAVLNNSTTFKHTDKKVCFIMSVVLFYLTAMLYSIPDLVSPHLPYSTLLYSTLLFSSLLFSLLFKS